MRNTVRKAFTLVEILIVVVILGILAAIVVPQFTSASEDAQIGNVETQLQTIRQQIELYRVRHNGDYPTLGEYTDNFGWGSADEGGLIGPDYLRTAPVNPRTGTATVLVGANPGAAVSSGDDGWWYDVNATDGKIFGCNGFREANEDEDTPEAGWIGEEAEEEVP